MTLAVTLLAHGCPFRAIVIACGIETGVFHDDGPFPPSRLRPPACVRQIERLFEHRLTSTIGIYALQPYPDNTVLGGFRLLRPLGGGLLHDPDILYLDEPTIGLDVVGKQRIRDFLRRMNQGRDLTVLLTMHDMTDIVQLCPRMLLINHSRLLYDGPVAAIRDRFGLERTLVVDLAEDETLDGPLNLGPAAQVQADGPRRWLRFRREEITAAALIAAVSARYRIRDLTIEEPEIEGIVRRLYEEGLYGEVAGP